MEFLKKDIFVGCGKSIEIFFLGDIHEGAKNHDSKAFKKAVNLIIDTHKKNKNTFVIGMGDYIDCINHRDPRFNPVEIADKYKIKDLKDLPRKQMQYQIDEMTPIMPLFIGWLYGNHEEKFSKWNGYDPMDKIRDWYEYKGQKPPILGYSGWINLGIRREKNRNRANYTFNFDLTHGVGGGGFREGYPINKVHDIFRWSEGADVHVMGHVHQMVDDMAQKRTFDVNGNRILTKKYYAANGCFLKKEDVGTRGYFEGKPGKYSSIGMLKFTIKVGTNKELCKTKLEKVFL